MGESLDLPAPARLPRCDRDDTYVFRRTAIGYDSQLLSPCSKSEVENADEDVGDPGLRAGEEAAPVSDHQGQSRHQANDKKVRL